MTIAWIVVITVLLQTSPGQGTCLSLLGFVYVASLSRNLADLERGIWATTDSAIDGVNLVRS